MGNEICSNVFHPGKASTPEMLVPICPDRSARGDNFLVQVIFMKDLLYLKIKPERGKYLGTGCFSMVSFHFSLEAHRECKIFFVLTFFNELIRQLKEWT